MVPFCIRKESSVFGETPIELKDFNASASTTVGCMRISQVLTEKAVIRSGSPEK